VEISLPLTKQVAPQCSVSAGAWFLPRVDFRRCTPISKTSTSNAKCDQMGPHVTYCYFTVLIVPDGSKEANFMLPWSLAGMRSEPSGGR